MGRFPASAPISTTGRANVSNSPLQVYRAQVADSWLDYNGHMNEGYYAVAFGDASDAYLIHAGFDADYRATKRGTFYTVETHIRYLQELQRADQLVCKTTVLGVDPKKLHLFHSMVHESNGYEAATQEAFLVHVDTDEVRSKPMSPELLAAIETDRDAHRGLAPDGAGRAIRPLRQTL